MRYSGTQEQETTENSSKPRATRPPRVPAPTSAAPVRLPKTFKAPSAAAGVTVDHDFAEKDWDDDEGNDGGKFDGGPSHKPAAASSTRDVPIGGVRADRDWLENNFDDDDEEDEGKR